jgi:very-short-patch-repair endonuclease/DNA-binding CsgD family transcriptional regulator
VIENEIVRLYLKENKSTLDIAKELNLSISKVRRTLLKNNITLRSKSEAQSLAIKEGKVEHPTKGKERSEDVKKRIAKGQHETWEMMEDDERERRSEVLKESYQNLPQSTKDYLQDKRHEGLRKAAKEGSKIEKFVNNLLLQAGYAVQYHRSNFLPNLKLEVDLLVPELKTAIEIDGPSHFFPIWGADALQKTIKADSEKAGLLLGSGFCLIRVKCLQRNISNYAMEVIGKKVLQELEKIKKQFPNKDNRFIEIET